MNIDRRGNTRVVRCLVVVAKVHVRVLLTVDPAVHCETSHVTGCSGLRGCVVGDKESRETSQRQGERICGVEALAPGRNYFKRNCVGSIAVFPLCVCQSVIERWRWWCGQNANSKAVRYYEKHVDALLHQPID